MISNLRLQHFRSYNDRNFDFSPAVNIIVGPNASGKTNLLEAVLVASKGSSYRVKDSDLIQFNKPWARLDAQLAGGGQRTVKVETVPLLKKSYQLDDKDYKRLSLEHSLPIVLFEPEHLRLLSGGPERRRDYLDDLLEQTVAGYGKLRRDYRRALAQRNALLKQPSQQLDIMLFPWNVRLSEMAGQIVRARVNLAEQLDDRLGDLYTSLSQTKTKVWLEYQPRFTPESYETHLLKKLEHDQALDQARGFTGSGPHREDFTVFFNDHPASETASRGEVRTTVLALKITELEILKAARQQLPILLLDDVFSELDSGRRHALTNYLKDYQTFITTTDADLVAGHFTARVQTITTINN